MVGLVIADTRLLDDLERIFDTQCDGLALVGDALARLFHSLGLGGRLGDALDAVGLGELLCRSALALGGVDVVHGVLDLGRQCDFGDERRHEGEAVGGHLLGNGSVDILGDVVLLGKDLIECVDGNRRAQGVGDEVTHLVDGLLQHVVALVDTRICRAGAHVIAHVVLSRDLKADGHVVLGLNVDAKTVFHGAQTHRGGFAVDHGHLHVEARVDDAVKLAQTLDDHGMLLFNDIAGVGKQ